MMVIYNQDLKPKSSSKSPGGKKRRSVSRGRSKSPARKASGKRSPRKSPSRSSSRKRQSPSRQSKTRATSHSRKTEKVDDEVKTEEVRSMVTGGGDATTPIISKESPVVLSEPGIRRSSRIAAKLAGEKVAPETPASTTQSKSAVSHYEFGGPIGTFLLTLLLPFTVYYINVSCSKSRCSVLEVPKFPKTWKKWFSINATLVVGVYMVTLALLSMLPIGNSVRSSKGGKRFTYRCNGVYSFWTCILLFIGLWFNGFPVVDYILQNFYQLLTILTLFSFAFSLFLYLRARRAKPAALSPTASGNTVYDFFMGRELNPRLFGRLDLKFFFELRPGLLGWVLIDLALLLSTLNNNDLLQWPSNPSLALITAGHLWYVYDALIFEKSILTTMDITTEGFGFMLCFGDIVWVPFLYTLSARFALIANPSLPLYQVIGSSLLFVTGYTIFRGANSQKDAFRANPYDPRFANLLSLSTGSSKKRLLAGGWWGLVRKPNYLGDLLMAFSWSFLTGFTNILPYFYALQLLVLLIHRERRDDAACRRKYGRYWDAYCDQVRYRLVPYIY